MHVARSAASIRGPSAVDTFGSYQLFYLDPFLLIELLLIVGESTLVGTNRIALHRTFEMSLWACNFHLHHGSRTISVRDKKKFDRQFATPE